MKLLLTKHINFRFGVYAAFFVLIAVLRLLGFFKPIDNFVYALALIFSQSNTWLKIWFVPTLVGSTAVALPILVFSALFFLKKYANRKALVYILGMAVIFLSGIFFKKIFQIERPAGLATFYAEPTTYSFPSGHAINSVLLCYFLPKFFGLIDQSFQQPVLAWRRRLFTFFGILLISISRVFLGVHWFSDILAGVIWGFAVSELGIFWLGKVILRMKHEIQSNHL